MFRRERERGHGASESGSALVELALVLPLLALILVGTADFARVFYTTIELTNAARAGAQYGAQNLGNSTDTTVMQNTAIAAAADISPITASASSKCVCATDDTATFATVSCSGTVACPTGLPAQHLIVTVTVTATKTFTTISHFPGIPNLPPISRSATLRVP